MKLIELNKRNYSFPENWNELNRKQLLQVMDILFLKGYKAEQMLLKLMPALTGMSMFRFFQCRLEELEEYFYLLAFLLQSEIEFTKNLLPAYKFSHTRFYGPSDFLDNLRMKEFTLTEDLFIRWFDSERQDEELLNELVAILYRPGRRFYNKKKNKHGDVREPFNQNTSSFYAKCYVSAWPIGVKLAIATWYNGCRQHIVKNNRDVFEGGGDDVAKYGLVSVMLSVAETHVFGDFEKVEEQYVSLIMMQLNEAIEKARRIEKTSTK